MLLKKIKQTKNLASACSQGVIHTGEEEYVHELWMRYIDDI